CACGAIAQTDILCAELDNLGVPLVETGKSHAVVAVRIDCSGVVVPALCLRLRRIQLVKGLLQGAAGKRTVDTEAIRIRAMGSALACRRAESFWEDHNATYDALWFVGIPVGGEIERRNIAEFLRNRGFPKFDFLAPRNKVSESKLPEFPASVLADARTRNNANQIGLSFGAFVCKDHVVWFSGTAFVAKDLFGVVTGREGFVVPLLVGKPKVEETALPESVTADRVSSPDSESAEAVQSAVPKQPANIFELLDPQPEVVEDVLDTPASPPPPKLHVVDAGETTSRKKTKPKVLSAEQRIVDKAVAKIEDPSVQTKPSNLCAFERCKEKIVSIAFCKYCDRKYCMTHRMPEIHSERCAAELKKGAMASFKNDAKLAIAIGRGETQGGKSGSLAKEREDAKKRLAEKIKKARK
ncbi:hypothetical protein HDU82_001637, partial [Entophlyctis luteolus]